MDLILKYISHENINILVEQCQRVFIEIQHTLTYYFSQNITSFNDLILCYKSNDALIVGYILCLIFIIYSFVLSIITGNCSKVDQLWSLVPVFYCWHFYLHYYLLNPAIPHYRLLLLCILVTCWGMRLTFNFWRKGGYGTFTESAEEDYRWPILRKSMHPIIFLIFNLTFIASYQNLLLYLITVPAYLVMNGPTNHNIYDIIVGCTFSIMLLIETIADEQHWGYQSYKHSLSIEERTNSSEPIIKQGFYNQGLFKYSRHPNYFAEQSMWVCIYLFTLTHNNLNSYEMNWTISGCIQLILLFQGSMQFGESITVSKYPLYKNYQKNTSQCIPLPKLFKVKND